MLTADEFMARVGSLPYSKRHGFATKLALENDPQLPKLIEELLATTPLPSRIPYPAVPDDPDSPKFIDLQFAQTTASKSFVQRELGLAMAIALGRPALPILMEALIHPSTAGKAKVIDACVKLASDEQLLDVYHRCVPAVQISLKERLSKADRRQVLASLGVPPPPAQALVEPELTVLERTLTSCAEYQREDAWNKTTLGRVWPDHHLRNPQYISDDSPLNLVEKLFEVLETFPPTRAGFKSLYKLPSAISHRFLSFLKADLPRSLALVTRLCRWVDTNGKHHISFPESFAQGRYYRRFWHGLDLETQRTHVEPFIANLLESNNGTLLKSGQLGGLDLLGEVRWPVVYSIAMKAIALLKNCKVEKERPNAIAFILDAIKKLHGRLMSLAAMDSNPKRNAQSAIEKGASEIIAQTVKHFLASLTATEKSDEEIVSKLQSMFLRSTLRAIDYHTLAKVLFENVRGVFSMQHVSAELLQGLGFEFLGTLKPKIRTVYTIPDNGVTQPYSNLPSGDNDSIFQVVLSLWPPREHLSFYTNSVVHHLSTSQKEQVWAVLNDPEYFVGRLGALDSRQIALSALRSFPPSPSARHAIIQQALLSDGTDQIILPLYALCDISDPAARAALNKMTYTRLFEERLEVYRTLITATQASKSVQEFITTMKFFVPRIKNEIPPDAQQLPWLFSVSDIIDLLRRATDEEAVEIASIYVAWETQVNEAVSAIPSISSHILDIVNHCLSIFAANTSGVFFQMALQILWARCLNEHGLSKAKVEFVTRSAYHAADTRTEADELAFRTFLAKVDKKADYGFWRIQDEAAYVEFMYRQNQKIYEPQSFDEANPTYPAFITAMLGCLGTRWSNVPRMRNYVEQQMDIIRGAKGTGDSPSDWGKNPVYNAVQFMLGLHRLYRGTMDKSPLPWWTEFRDLRLLSSSASEEMDLRWRECRDEKGSMVLAKLDALVELMLRIDDTAVYVSFVSHHIISARQDLLDRFITKTGKYGVFNPAPHDYAEGDKIEPVRNWDFRYATRFSPHQCEVFAEMLLSVIRSNEFPLRTRVQATEQFTQLPTTTIHELAALLTEDNLNPRIAEAILMFLPRLDEPAAGIQFLLAPTILAGELARTAVHSVKRSLEHVPLASVPTFLEPPTAKSLKIGVFKELVRIITTYIELPEMQDLVKRLWDRPLHQDVRIALLQSILPALNSPHQNLAWYIIDKAAASLNTLQADNTLFVLLAVIPEVSTACVDDVLRTYLPRSPVLADMATVTIPEAHCNRYVETVLWPLTQIRLNMDLAESIKADKKKAAELAERIPLIRSSSYITCFDSFLGPDNALSFAERAAKDYQELVDIGLESYKPGNKFGSLPEEKLALYLTECIGHCVAQNQMCWRFLLETIGFLASRVADFQRSPTPQGHRSIKQLQALRLANNFLFHSPEPLCLKVTHDRMELLKPLAEHGVEDFFATTIYQRRFNLFRARVARILKNSTGEDILSEGRALLTGIIKLSHGCHHTFEETITHLVDLLNVIPSASIPVIRREILAGDHGVAEAPWVNSVQLRTLEKTYSCTPSYANELGTFHTHVATQQPTFYQQNYASFESLIRKILNDSLAKESQLGSYEAFRLLVEPVIQRQRQSNSEEEGDMIVNLFKGYSYRFFTLAPECAQSLIQDALMRARPGKSDSLARAREMVALLISHVTCTGRDSASFPAAFFLETIYSGNFLSLALDKTIHTGDAALSFPYFFGSDDPSGGDIEDRSTKSTLAAVQALYDGWKARHASSFLQKTGDKTSTYSSSIALLVVLDTYKDSPKLILANPGLFFSCLCLSLSDADLHSYSTKLFSSLREVLTPLEAHKKRAKWVPPAELTLSFVHKMLVELPDEVSDAVVGAFNVGVTKSKHEAVSLLIWWTETFLSSHARPELVEAEGRERLLSIYEELRVLAIGDGDAIVRVTALEKLPKASDL